MFICWCVTGGLSSAGDPATAPNNSAVDVHSVILLTVGSAACEAQYACRLRLPAKRHPVYHRQLHCRWYCESHSPPQALKGDENAVSWIQSLYPQDYCQIRWSPGELNLVDYFTKTHPLTFFGKTHPPVSLAAPRDYHSFCLLCTQMKGCVDEIMCAVALTSRYGGF